MAVYIDRNIFYTRDKSYETDEFQDISQEKIDYAYNRHVDNYFKDDDRDDDDGADQVCLDGRFCVTDKDFCKRSQEWANSDLFYGDFLNGKRNAWGCYQWDNGEVSNTLCRYLFFYTLLTVFSFVLLCSTNIYHIL
ncbi:unnamed protein product [Trichobilharzia regenti]|nr:unnamed protein product [Trichobilharzia regenti]